MSEDPSIGHGTTLRRILAAAACAMLLSACAHDPGRAPDVRDTPMANQPAKQPAAQPTKCPAHANLDAALWARSSAEYQAAARQVFRGAALQMDRALADPTWTAALEQDPATMADLPPAIIVDVDETILDNSPFQAYLVATNLVYGPDTWTPWVEQSAAEALPGAKQFLDQADQRGVTIFYVTNRRADAEKATRLNLERQQLPIEEAFDTVLMKGENGWSSDKTTRRQAVAQTHRVLLVFGDDLNDFVSGAKTKTPEPRRQLAETHAAMWGERWFLVSNPTYGSWEASLFGRQYGLPEHEKLCEKYRYLAPYTPR